MKKIITWTALGIVATHAGEIRTTPSPQTQSFPPKILNGWITPTLDLRARYEYADINNALDEANAFSLRSRLGFKTKAFQGLSAIVEGEFSRALIDDYHGGATGATPNHGTKYDTIADPETTELNQAYLQYSAYDSVVKLGRQRIILNNAAHVGNVGWRQNEQTYDGLSIVNTSFANATLTYAYINQVNRIFGSESNGIANEFEGDVQLLNGAYTIKPGTTFGAYAYLMDFDDSAKKFSNNTFGVSATTLLAGLNLYAEAAAQTEGSSAQKDKDTGYFHAYAAKTLGIHTLTLGYEYLGASFAAPLSTAHAFNGFADVFVADRLGGGIGLSNPYITYATTLPFYEIKSATTLHSMMDNGGGESFGWEIDQVLSKKFTPQITGIFKAAIFTSDKIKYPDTARVSAELDFAF